MKLFNFAISFKTKKKRKKMQNFAAIDFETANQHRSSVCSVGIVIVRKGVIVDKYYSFIRPEPNFYTYFTTQVHGLTDADTNNAPSFPQVWQEITKKIDNLPLLAHNSPFDEGCLRAVFKLHNMPYPNYKFHCTCQASRRIFKDLPNHQLQTVAKQCGYNLTNHHHALADAEACAIIGMQIIEEKNTII